MGLRETLEAATRPDRDVPLQDWNDEVYDWYVKRGEARAWLSDRAPELAAEVLELRERHREAMALVLDMGEALRLAWDEDTWDEFLETDTTALLARLDQLGEEQT